MRILTTLATALALSALAAHAAPPTETPAPEGKPHEVKSAQQNRMKTCSADAKLKELKGTERRAFMSECLRKKA